MIGNLETQLWFYYLAVSYINVGCEAFHLGQVGLIGAEDKDLTEYSKLLARIRAYAKAHARRHLGLPQQRRQVHPAGLPVRGRARPQPVHAAHHFIQGAEAQPRHSLAQLFGHEGHEVDDIFGLAGEARAQLRVLGGHARRAGS